MNSTEELVEHIDGSSEPMYKRYSVFIGLFIVLFLFGDYSIYRFSTKGVFTICQVDHYEPAGSGSFLYINVYHQGKKYKTVANSMCGGCDGNFFFVQIIKNEPMGTVQFLRAQPVPDCISLDKIPFEGWAQIPNCQ